MAVEFEISVENLKQVQQAAEEVVDKIARSGSLVARAALVIERQAKINATGRPGPRVRTGRLRSSITTEVLSPELARVGTNVYYAPFVEFGHYTGGSRKFGVSFGHMTPAYPFLGPTIEQTKDEVGDVVVAFGNELGATWSNP